MPGAVHYIDVWQSASRQDREDARSLWTREGALAGEAVIGRRLDELCVLARDDAGRLLAITTAYPDFDAALAARVYVMRMYVRESARRSRVGFGLLHAVIEALEHRWLAGDGDDCVGILFELENEAVIRTRNEAIWPTTGFVYIGTSARGAHRRIRYFDGAVIVPRP